MAGAPTTAFAVVLMSAGAGEPSTATPAPQQMEERARGQGHASPKAGARSSQGVCVSHSNPTPPVAADDSFRTLVGSNDRREAKTPETDSPGPVEAVVPREISDDSSLSYGNIIMIAVLVARVVLSIYCTCLAIYSLATTEYALYLSFIPLILTIAGRRVVHTPGTFSWPMRSFPAVMPSLELFLYF